MSQSTLVCLSSAPNLRCVGFTPAQSAGLVIPSGIEAIISLLFICSYSGPRRWAQAPLAADSILYFIWALLDMLSHVVPAARNSSSVFEALDFFVGAVSFTTIIIYSVYLYRLSFHEFIPTLPRRLQPCLKICLPILFLIAVVLNEVSSFVGTQFATSSEHNLTVEFPNHSESLWLFLSQSALAVYTIIQFIFFLLAFSRLSCAFLDQRRIEITHSDEHHFYHGISWINAGIIIGVVESVSGFPRVSFGVVLARRILRLLSRAILMSGLLKGFDVTENFENLTDELRGVSRIGYRVSHMLGINARRATVLRRIPQTYIEQSSADKRSTSEKRREQRVTVQYEKGQAPSLHIRFSQLDFPAQAVLADVTQQRRRSMSGSLPGRTGGSAQLHGPNASDGMAAARNPALESRRAKSALMAADAGLPEPVRPRFSSGATVSDSLSIVRDLELKFPNLPPRVTGKYRGSILGQNYEEDPFPVVGVSRQSSMCQNGSDEGGAALSSSGSIKRKPAPPLLDNITYISDRHKRPTSTWGGLTRNPVIQPLDSSPVSNSPWESTTVYSSDPALSGEPTTPTPPRPRRRTTARDLIRRASRALSDASIRSAEWLVSANSPQSQSSRTPLTAADIELYRRGNLGPEPVRLMPSMGEAGSW